MQYIESFEIDETRAFWGDEMMSMTGILLSSIVGLNIVVSYVEVMLCEWFFKLK